VWLDSKLEIGTPDWYGADRTETWTATDVLSNEARTLSTLMVKERLRTLTVEERRRKLPEALAMQQARAAEHAGILAVHAILQE